MEQEVRGKPGGESPEQPQNWGDACRDMGGIRGLLRGQRGRAHL